MRTRRETWYADGWLWLGEYDEFGLSLKFCRRCVGRRVRVIEPAFPH